MSFWGDIPCYRVDRLLDNYGGVSISVQKVVGPVEATHQHGDRSRSDVLVVFCMKNIPYTFDIYALTELSSDYSSVILQLENWQQAVYNQPNARLIGEGTERMLMKLIARFQILAAPMK